DDIHVVTVAVALISVERNVLAVVRPHQAAVLKVTGGQLADIAGARVVVDLGVLIAIMVFQKCEAAAAGGRRASHTDRVRGKRELLTRCQGTGDPVYLLDVAETRRHQHTAVRLPVEKRGLT